MSAGIATQSELDGLTRRLWVAIVASTLAFALTGALGWLIAGVACRDGSRDLGPLSPTGVRLLIGMIAAAGLFVTAYGASLGFREWRSRAPDGELQDVAGSDRQKFLALSALLVSSVFLLGIVWEGLPAVLVDVCEAIR
jgi:hypothetical protein